MTLSQKIVKLRESADLSQKELAQKVGVSTGTVAEWESEDTVPTLGEISKLSEIFSVSTDVLIKETESIGDAPVEVHASFLEESNTRQVKHKKPLYKKVWFWILVLSAVVVAVVLVLLLFFSEVKPKYDENGKPIFVDLTDEVYTNADDYIGYFISVKGKVFQALGDDGEQKGLHLWLDPDTCEQNLMVYYSTDQAFDVGDYVVFSGYIKDIHSYSNAYGANLCVPLVISTDIAESSYIDVMAPTVEIYSPEDLIYVTDGYSIYIDSVEFAASETRVYITVSNNSDTALYVDTMSAVVLQDGSQYNSTINYEADYSELPYSLIKGATASGILVFPTISINRFALQIEVHTETATPEVITFSISKYGSSVSGPLIEPNAIWDYEQVGYKIHGYEIQLDKVEFYNDETRIYLIITNDGKATLNVFADSSLIIQNKKQFNVESKYDATFEEFPYSIATGASAAGAISFPAIDQTEFEYAINIYSDDYDEEIEDIIFFITETEAYCKTEIKEDNKQDGSPETTPPQTDNSNENPYTAAIVVAQSYIRSEEDATPNEIKSYMREYYSENEINYALYNGYIDWSESIRLNIWYIRHEKEATTVTRCGKCGRRFFGEYQACPYLNCRGGIGWSYYYGYSRAETISKLLSLGFLQGDVDAVMREYEYGEFIDEHDFSDCITVTGTLCDHVWSRATCQEIATCIYCGETKGDFAKHVYDNHKCIWCQKEEPWTPPKIECSDWVSLAELDEKAQYNVEKKYGSVKLRHSYGDPFTITNMPTEMMPGTVYEVVCNGITILFKYEGDSSHIYDNMKFRYSDLVLAGILA